MIRRLEQRIGFFRIAHFRRLLNRMTNGKVGLYSTAEHYSTGPAAKVLSYYQYDGSKRITCPICGWSGASEQGNREHYSELFDVSCPTCDKMLLVVGFPTIEETEMAARRGNEEAQRELARINEFRAKG